MGSKVHRGRYEEIEANNCVSQHYEYQSIPNTRRKPSCRGSVSSKPSLFKKPSSSDSTESLQPGRSVASSGIKWPLWSWLPAFIHFLIKKHRWNMMKRFSFTFTHRPWTTLSDLIGLQLGLQSIQLSSELSFHRGHIHCLQLQNFATWTTNFRTAHHKRVMPTLKSHLFYVQVSPSCILHSLARFAKGMMERFTFG